DGRSDLYALGLLLYEMLTGEPPYSAATEAEMIAQRLSASPKSLRWPAAVPPTVRAVVQRLLARDPARRPQSAGEVIQELDRGPPARPMWAWKWIAAGAGSLLLLALLGWALHRRAPRPDAVAKKTAPAAGPRHAVALLPLADETGRPDLAWVATGMPEMLAS